MSTVKVMISIPRPLHEVVDRAASEEHRSRSERLREAARFYLEARASRGRPQDDRQVQQAVALMDRLAQDDRPVPGWNTVGAVRRVRRRQPT